MAHYIRPFTFIYIILLFSFTTVFHTLPLPLIPIFPFTFSASISSSYVLFFLLATNMNENGRRYKSRCPGALQVCTFLHLVNARQIEDLGANGIWLQNKTAIQMLFFSGMIFLLSVRSQYSLVLLLLQSHPFNLMKRMNTTAVPATKTSRRCSRTLLILAEIQKTDLARTGVDFVEIKGSLSPSPPTPVSIRRIREDMSYLNTYREDEEHIPFCIHCNCSWFHSEWVGEHLNTACHCFLKENKLIISLLIKP